MGKIRYFEGIRGLAALLVVMNHFVCGFFPALYFDGNNQAYSRLDFLIAQTPLNLIYNGNFAVCIFFVLSGYVLSYKFFTSPSSASLTEGAFKRYIRLTVPIFLSLLLAFAVSNLGLFNNVNVGAITQSAWITDFWKTPVGITEYLKAAFYGSIFKNDNALNPVLWTMQYEFFGSFLIFGFLALFGRLLYRVIIYVCLIAIFWNTYYLAFILGIMLCDYSNRETKIRMPKALTLVCGLVGLYVGSFPETKFYDSAAYHFIKFTSLNAHLPEFYHIIGAALIIFSVIHSDILKALFSTKIFGFLGKISFSLYLTHLIVICSLSAFLFTKFTEHFSYKVAFLFTFIPSVAVMFAIAYVFYLFVDRKGISLASAIYNEWFKKS